MAKTTKDNEDQPEKNSGSDDSSDNFGLPDIEYKPLDRTEPSAEPVQAKYEETESNSGDGNSYTYEEEEGSSRAPVFIALIIAVVVIVSGFLVYKYWYVPKADREKKERIAKEDAQRKADEEARLAKEREEAERKRLEAEAAAKAKPAAGTIETLSERTRRYFVVVSSNIDDDLVMDYAKKLSAKGVNTKIIPPFGKAQYFRLSIGDFDTFAAAQSSADAAKAEYGNALWVIKY